MFKLPFSFTPGSWGLRGRTKEVAQAEYELSGYELEKRLIEIRRDEFSDKDLQTKLFELEFKYGKIDKFAHLRSLAGLIDDPKQQALAMLELDYKEDKLTDMQYQKQSATLKHEPWVTVLSMDFGGKQSLEGSFELDWNEFFVENLQTEGYIGGTPDAIVNQWFMEVCRNVAMEEFDGTGNFTADSAANLDAMKRWNSAEPVGEKHRGYK